MTLARGRTTVRVRTAETDRPRAYADLERTALIVESEVRALPSPMLTQTTKA